MLSSRLLNAAVLGVALIAGGCDRQSSDKAQPAASASGQEPPGSIDRSHKGSLLPNFTLNDAKGGKLRLQALKGKPLLINLWATWCAPCIAEMPTLDALAKVRGGEVRVLTVSQDMAQTEKVAEFMTQRGFSHIEPWLDPETDLAFHYKAETLPATIYYDAQGREVWRYIGGQDWSGEGAAKLLAEGLGG